MSNCETHDVETLTREWPTAPVFNWCPDCRERICFRCSKVAPESWMSGHCHDCYRIIRLDTEARKAEYARKREMEKLADAWDEGFCDGERRSAEGDDGPTFKNPYRLPQMEDGASRD